MIGRVKMHRGADLAEIGNTPALPGPIHGTPHERNEQSHEARGNRRRDQDLHRGESTRWNGPESGPGKGPHQCRSTIHGDILPNEPSMSGGN